jgi:hypothetical protein
MFVHTPAFLQCTQLRASTIAASVTVLSRDLPCQQQAAAYMCTYTHIHSHVHTIWCKCAHVLQTIDKGYTHPVQIPYDAEWLCLDKNDEYTASDSKIQIYCGACGAKPPAVSGGTKPPVTTAAPTDIETEAPTAVSSLLRPYTLLCVCTTCSYRELRSKYLCSPWLTQVATVDTS